MVFRQEHASGLQSVITDPEQFFRLRIIQMMYQTQRKYDIKRLRLCERHIIYTFIYESCPVAIRFARIVNVFGAEVISHILNGFRKEIKYVPRAATDIKYP